MEETTFETEKTLLVKRDDGTEFRVTIPAGSKVTFGYFNPGSDSSRYPNSGGTRSALRIYESKEKQIACFLGVIEFRDMALDIEFKVDKIKLQESLETDGRNSKSNRERLIESTWVTQDTFDSIPVDVKTNKKRNDNDW